MAACKVVICCAVVLSLAAFAESSASAQSTGKLTAINKKVAGKWVSTDGKSYIEFFPDLSCETGSLWPDKKWHVDKGKLEMWQVGNSFRCGDGALDLKGSNTMTRDYGMGGEPDVFHRKAAAPRH